MIAQVPTEGTIVHFVLPDGQHRPAIVVRKWSHRAVNLTVFTDWANDSETLKNSLHGAGGVTRGLFWATSVEMDTDTHQPGTWHWVEDDK